MKIAVQKKDIGDFFVSWGWLVLIALILSYTAWYWAITAIDAIKNTEKINFFIESYGLKANTLSDDVVAKFADQGVVESNVYCYAPNDVSISSYYTKFGNESDFIILYQSDLDTMFQNPDSTSVLSSFVPFSSDLKKATMSQDDYAYYQVKGEDYALKVYDSADASYNTAHPFTSLIDFSSSTKNGESSYLLLNAKTPNLKPYNTTSTTGNAVLALQYFLALYHA
jgi:hypothetical protein